MIYLATPQQENTFPGVMRFTILVEFFLVIIMNNAPE